MDVRQLIPDGIIGKRILISGGTGFIGKNILLYFLNNKLKPDLVTILTRNATNFKKIYPQLATLPFISFYETDIVNPLSCNENYDYVIHAAASVIEHVQPIQLLNEIILGSRNMLDLATQTGARSFLNISSGSIYGRINQKHKVAESYIGLPVLENSSSSYGLGKLLAEHYSYLSANEQLKITTLRCFCFGGDYLDKKHYALGDFINKAINNEDIVVQSGSEIYRSYLSTTDLLEWMLFLLIKGEYMPQNYAVYNIGSDAALTIPELAHKVVEVLDSSSRVICPNLDNKDVSYYIPNIDKVKSLGLTINDSLEQIILKTRDYYIQR